MEQSFKFEFSVKDANTILQALSQMPYAQVFELVDNVKRQAEAQMQPPAEAAPE